MKNMNTFPKDLPNYPGDIVETLFRLIHIRPEGKEFDECIDALYNIRAIAENSYNKDGYRILYYVLNELADKNYELRYNNNIEYDDD